MRPTLLLASCALAAVPAAAALGQATPVASISAFADTTTNLDVRTMVSRLTLENYKATVKGLTQFGDRRQGTKRNRDAVDWIEAQLKSYGCTNTERITYDYHTPPPRGGAGRGGRGGAGGGRGAPRPPGTVVSEGPTNGQGGSRIFGTRTQTGVNTDSLRQPDAHIRAIDAEPATDGERQEVYCTKVGSVHPNEMYIVGGHMDGHGWNEAANDDGSGTALVMELARVFSSPDVKTDRSIRFVLWNNEETGLNGAHAYVDQRQALQGKESPAGSGKYPEPKWLGMIQHDMMMWDHGMPGPDGKLNPEQRREADVNIEFASTSKMAQASADLAWFFRRANEHYATDYPANVGPHMTNTDSDPFKDLVPAISLRENERGSQIGAGWDPNWHQPSDVFATYSDKDFRLGLNAAETTLAAVALLTGATVGK
ncbi:MAG TPA: M28 family peptidase [Gemmatimonadaceae bacterium]|nr:M28 family peptidase [Gemmatimonadaceae bacterium]